MNRWLKRFYQLGTPHFFFAFADKWHTKIFMLALSLLAIGGVWGFLFAPADYQQGDAFRIIYVHVPSAWLSMFIYAVMAVSAVIALVWRVRMAEIALISSAMIGAGFTLIALITGAIWGKPMWGTWWVWDARLTSELILLFVYLGIIALYRAMEDQQNVGRAVSILTVVGVVNLPIIHYSVVWWNTLHQASSVTKIDAPSIHIDMLLPLLIVAIGFKLFYAWLLLIRMQTELLHQDMSAGWLRAYLTKAEIKTKANQQ